MKTSRFLFIAVFVLSLCLPRFADADDGEKLLKIVALSRHGVRAPTQSEKTLKSWSQKPWPVWPVKRGDLTPRGARLVSAMWRDMRGDFDKLGLTPENACPAPDAVFVRADVDERTRATAWALIDGLAPDCSIGYAALKDEELDPLFHPVKAGLYRYNPVSVAAEVLSMTDGGLRKLQEDLSGAVSLMGEIIGPPSEMICERFTLSPRCGLEDLPSAISVSYDGSVAHITGALAITSSVAEIFLLEYGEWPDASAGWGSVDDRVLGRLLPAHSKVFDVVNRAPVVAWAQGSSLLKEIADALADRHYDKRANDARLVVFVGHDTNIANVGALAGLDWQAKGYPPNGIPPAGVLFFELWEKNGAKEIRVKFYAQPPRALHAPFDDASPDSAHAAAAGRVTTGEDATAAIYDEARFLALVQTATNGAPIAPESRPEFEYNLPKHSE